MTELRKTAYSNISNCFPEKKQPQVTLLVKQHFEAIGISLFETANAYYASDKKIKKMLTINNAPTSINQFSDSFAISLKEFE